MFKIETSNQFEKDYILALKRGLKIELLQSVIELLEKFGTIPKNYKPHKLHGKFADYWECHIKGDWLLIWKLDILKNTIYLIRTGTHSDLF